MRVDLFGRFVTGKKPCVGYVIGTVYGGGGPFRRRRFGAGQLGAVPFRRRTFRRRFLIYFYFSSYEEKTMKQAIS